MESSEIGQKMRAAFEATRPSEAEVLQRYGHLRGLRSGEDLPAATGEDELAGRRSIRRGVSVGVAALLAAAAALFVWSLPAERPVAIGPSLERDLQTRRERASGPPPAPEETPQAEGTAEGRVRASAKPIAVLPRRAPEVSTLHPALPNRTETDASWARVTEAMRQRDWTAAHAALAPLLVSTERETQDSARLVRVRLELGAAQGQVADARWLSELEDLARSGSSSSIRASARRLLETLREDGTKQSSPVGELPQVEE